MRHVNDHVGPKIVLIVMGVWLFSLGLSFGSYEVAAEPVEELSYLGVGEYDAAEEHLRLGVDFFLTDELDVAIDEFREAAHQKPDYADAYHNLGVTLAKTGDLTQAIAAWTEAEGLDPAAWSLRYSVPALVAYNYGVSLVRDGRIEQAMKEWQSALRIQENFVEAHYALGLGFLAVHNPAVATAHLQAALSLAPDWVQAHVALGQAHYESHEYDLARAAWLKALALNPGEVRAYANLGLLAVQEGNNREAIDYARQAIALQPGLVSAHFHLGVALLARGEAQASVDAFEQALALDARFTPARLLLGVAWSRMGDWARAAHDWREALRRDPFGLETFWLHANVGIALTSMGHFQDATKEFQWVVEQRPEWAQGWSQLGLSLMSERRWDEAVVALETAAHLQPHWAHLQFSLGKAHAGQGELASAAQAFREAVRISSNFVDALFHLGLVLRAQNELIEAVDPLRRAAEGGSREAQGLLASMYVNGNGVDRNVPLAMLWWSRSSRASIPDTMTRTAQNQFAQLRRRLHREQFTPTERQDVLTGFGLIRQDLLNQAPVQFQASALSLDPGVRNHGASSEMVLRWMVERALALDARAHQTLREWYVDGVVGQLAPQNSFLQKYWLQVAKEGDPVGCELIDFMTPKENFHAVRQACQSLGT
ncbi:MAG: tetratricopeptide repeat protein [Nitrospirales bacterium]